MMEYENSPDNPVPDMQKGMDNWKKAWSAKKDDQGAAEALLQDVKKESKK
jgi:hypothetical protein